jgi:pyruvate dehydrogenase E1 component
MSVEYDSQEAYIDPDPQETDEWLEAFDGMMLDAGPDRCRGLLSKLAERARQNGISCETLLNSPYCNTIPPHLQPPYPGNLDLERKITALIRWNALAMVMRSNRQSGELGGHLASYASSADLFETGFNHFFRGNRSADPSARSADMIFF